MKDTGIGIPKARQEAIFDRFIQADISDKRAFQGAGLGLSISKAYVEMLGGKIRVESEEGAGSAFYFTIPFIPEPTEKNNLNNIPPESETANQLQNLKILIVEDDETSELLLTIAVRMFSKQILKAGTGKEAVEACRDNPDIDLILMDMKMPVMDGFTATRKIREFNRDVIIIAQTAYGLAGDKEKAMEAGCTGYISKPFNKASLAALVQHIIKNGEHREVLL
ncbi:MAG: response regulator [Bacteroidota bacterium]